MALTLRSVTTPGNNMPAFRSNLERLRNAKKLALGLAKPPQTVMQAGAGYEGANIYVRVLLGLQSPLRDEQDFALHHLLKISHERGDKYRFDAFQGLAEALVEYALKIASIFYEVLWEVVWNEDQSSPAMLDGINGTPDILDRIESFKPRQVVDLDSEEVAHTVTKVTEAVLTLRNLSLLLENAQYLARLPPLRDLLTIVISLPHAPQVLEIKHCILEITEQVTRYWEMPTFDPLYISLLKVVEESFDRGAIVSALFSLCQISLELEDQNDLNHVPFGFLRRLFEWCMLEDEELVQASLRFVYQYTSNLDNVSELLSKSVEIGLPAFLRQLVRLLEDKAVTTYEKIMVSPAISAPTAKSIPVAPAEMMEHFVKYAEPDRSTLWLKSVIEEDPNESITQLEIWQAYSKRFSEFITPQAGLLQASEFIKLVSTIFSGATAQIVDEGGRNKYTVKGICPRHFPVDPKGRQFTRCLWISPGSTRCGEFRKPQQMLEHVAQAHLGLNRNAEGKWDFSSSSNESDQPLECHWANCRHFSRLHEEPPSLLKLGLHVKTHLPDVSSKASIHQRHNRTLANKTTSVDANSTSTKFPDFDPDLGKEATYMTNMVQQSRTDETGRPVGVASVACMVLRNLAKNVPRAITSSQMVDADRARKRRMKTLFVPLLQRLMNILTYNPSLMNDIMDIIILIEQGAE